MTRWVLWCLVLVASLSILAIGGRIYMRAHAETSDARVTLHQVQASVAELSRLRSGGPSIPMARRPASALPSVLSAGLAAAGVPNQSLASFNASSPAAIDGGHGLTKERANLVLNPITLPQLGRVLAAWRESEPAWAITNIELSPLPLERAVSAHPTGGDRPISATLTLEAIVREADASLLIEPGPSSPRRAASTASPQRFSKEPPR
jgi:hypothetical protein